jgi:uncharacterized membrane protein YqjE
VEPQPSPPPVTGPAASLRALGATLFEVVATRAELAAVEFREEGERHKQAIMLSAVAAMFLAMGLLLAAVFVVVLFWDTHRLLALAAVTVFYLGIAALAYLRLKRDARAAPPPFEATLRELAADREMLRGRGE